MFDLIFINGVHLVFMGGLVLLTGGLLVFVSYCFFRNLVKAQKEIEDDGGPL